MLARHLVKLSSFASTGPCDAEREGLAGESGVRKGNGPGRQTKKAVHNGEHWSPNLE